METKKWYQKTWVLTVLVVLVIGGLLSISRHRKAPVAPTDPQLAAALAVDTVSAGPARRQDQAELDAALKLGEVDPESMERKDLIKKQFSSWDGSHRGLEKLIKKSMNDPGSYDHEETSYLDKGDHLLVQTKFRGKNAYGGTVLNTVTAKVDFKGNVLEVLE